LARQFGQHDSSEFLKANKKEKQMSKFDRVIKPLKWFMALGLIAVVSGCGGADPILGGTSGTTTASTLSDVIRPRVTLTVPANLETVNAAANAAIVAIFSEAMAPATVTAATTFTLKETVSGNNVPGGVVVYAPSSRSATFKPTAALTVGLGYTAIITTGATDVAGNALAGNQAALPAASNYVWTFTATAADLTAPTVTQTSPLNAATGVSLNSAINATFSKAIDPVTIDIASFTLQLTTGPGPILAGVVSYDAATKIATLTPSSNLLANTNYTATVTTSVKDLAANALAVNKVWTFATGTGLAAGAVVLGSASTFGIMATSAITSTGNSVINGDVSLNPGTSMTGFPPRSCERFNTH
jgi:hypothetical protein